MSRLFDDAASQYMEYGNAILTGDPITVSAWIYPDDLTLGQTVVSLSVSTINHEYALTFRGDVANDPIIWRKRGTSDRFASVTGVTANTWQHVCGVEAAANSRAVYLNSTKGTNTQTATIGTPDRTVIGRSSTLTIGNYFSGRIAEVGIWNVALSDEEVVRLSRGEAPPFIRRENLIFYDEILGLHSPEPDLSGFNQHMIVNGPIAAEHPPGIVPFPARYGLWRPPLLMR